MQAHINKTAATRWATIQVGREHIGKAERLRDALQERYSCPVSVAGAARTAVDWMLLALERQGSGITGVGRHG